MAREVFIPNMLGSYIRTASNEISTAPFKDRPEPSNTPFSNERTKQSLTKFAKDISGQDLNDYMLSFAKKIAYTTRRFSLQAAFHSRTSRHIEAEGMGEFFFDGDFGFALGINSYVEPESKIWLAVTSFCLGNDVEDYFPHKENPLKGAMPYEYPHPVIVQIQGPSPSTYGRWQREELYCEAMSVLQNYKWERALIGLTLDWAREEGIPSVYLLPAAKNRWTKSREQLERFEMRYDVSAKRLGFRLQPNGLYATSVE